MNEKPAPIIEFDKEIRVEAYLDTVEQGQWPRGVFYANAYTLLTSRDHAKTPGKQLNSRQEERAAALADSLRGRMIDALSASGWRPVAHTKAGLPIWQHRPGAAASSSPTIAPEQESVTDQSRQGRTRTVFTRSITFTCQQCHQEVTEQRYPSHTPLYCSKPECKKEATRAKTRERVAEWRKLHPDARKKKV